jgi:hypothetical protein
MMNTCESAKKFVTPEQVKWLKHLSQNGNEGKNEAPISSFVIKSFPDDSGHLTQRLLSWGNVETSYLSQVTGTANRKIGLRRCEFGRSEKAKAVL